MGARRFSAALVAALVLALVAGCDAAAPTDAPSAGPNPDATVAPGTTGSIDLDGRPFRLHVPAGYDPAAPTPLLVGLHGYTSDSGELDSYFGLTAASDERGFLLALPDGLENPRGDRYWNAVDGGCCDFSGADTDDSGYLSRLIDHVRSSYAVGPVALVGHSNGGYMSHRLACEHADQVDAIASLAGPLPADTSRCAPSRPVRVLHVHGDADDTVPYLGGALSSASAEETVEAWARLDGCEPSPLPLPAMDLDASIPGPETTVLRYADGCAEGLRVELWTIAGGGHVPELGPAFTPAVLDFLFG